MSAFEAEEAFRRKLQTLGADRCFWKCVKEYQDDHLTRQESQCLLNCWDKFSMTTKKASRVYYEAEDNRRKLHWIKKETENREKENEKET
ncbi:hypothetical protein PROFUN_04576 [Planoprotostelium fungivorum]|uniref:Mitochondrial import inner membrane translocase subunit n=1 Tax=Planoprotostelium fungivorum TaxID=1890364 RepID=A0A2P6NBL7_9EUKA|nr:hypothetical protein PROFUN_04576 [Planoprotostelium fungivorum]